MLGSAPDISWAFGKRERVRVAGQTVLPAHRAGAAPQRRRRAARRRPGRRAGADGAGAGRRAGPHRRPTGPGAVAALGHRGRAAARGGDAGGARRARRRAPAHRAARRAARRPRVRRSGRGAGGRGRHGGRGGSPVRFRCRRRGWPSPPPSLLGAGRPGRGAGGVLAGIGAVGRVDRRRLARAAAIRRWPRRPDHRVAGCRSARRGRRLDGAARPAGFGPALAPPSPRVGAAAAQLLLRVVAPRWWRPVPSPCCAPRP